MHQKGNHHKIIIYFALIATELYRRAFIVHLLIFFELTTDNTEIPKSMHYLYWISLLTAAILIAADASERCPLSCRCEPLENPSNYARQLVELPPELRVVCQDAPWMRLPVDELALSSLNRSLTELVFERATIETLSSADLQRLERLRKLVFVNVRIHKVFEHRLHGLSALEELVFRNVSTDAQPGVAILISNNVRLERLSYTQSALTKLDRQPLLGNSVLRFVDFSSNQLEHLDRSAVRSFVHSSPDLFELKLEGNRLRGWPSASLSQRVGRVNLANNDLGSSAQPISNLIPAGSELVAIDLSNNGLSWNDVDYPVLQRARKLEVFRASRNHFGPTISFNTCENLVEVNLTACALTAFPAFPAAGCRRLSILKLDENSIESLNLMARHSSSSKSYRSPGISSERSTRASFCDRRRDFSD